MNSPSLPAARSSKLDLLRILLCACVLICHFYPGYHALAGHVAVLGFFVLSGYLLQASFYKMEHFEVERFYAGKAKRLLPVYILSILLSLVLVVYSALVGYGVSILPAEQDIFSVFKYIWYYNTPAWYMGCLLVFLFMAPALWCLHRMRWGILSIFACSLAFAVFLYWRYDGTPYVLMGMEGKMCPYPQVRLWQFVAGMVVCRCAHRSSLHLHPWSRGFLSTVVFLLLLSLSLWVSCHFRRGYDFPNAFCFDLPAIAMLAALAALLDDKCMWRSWTAGGLTAWLASLTYGVYLFHIPVRNLLSVVLNKFVPDLMPVGAKIALFIIVSMLLADAVNRACAWYWRKR